MKTYVKRHFKAIELFVEVALLIALFLLGVLEDILKVGGCRESDF